MTGIVQVSDAWMRNPFIGSDGRRPRSAKARNRGKRGAGVHQGYGDLPGGRALMGLRGAGRSAMQRPGDKRAGSRQHGNLGCSLRCEALPVPDVAASWRSHAKPCFAWTRHRAAALDGAHHLQLVEADVAAVGITPGGTVVAEYLRDLHAPIISAVPKVARVGTGTTATRSRSRDQGWKTMLGRFDDARTRLCCTPI